jgi:hypothetical protein
VRRWRWRRRVLERWTRYKPLSYSGECKQTSNITIKQPAHRGCVRVCCACRQPSPQPGAHMCVCGLCACRF